MTRMPIFSSFQPASRLLLLAALLLAVSGCKTISDIKQGDDLDRALKAYEAAMRWSDYAAALTYHKWAEGEPVPLPEDFASLRVMEYYVVYPPVTSSDATAQQAVEISYVNQDYQILRKVTDRQTWAYNKDIKRWEITSPMPLPSAAPAQ
jgi:hypothetical protein